MTSISTDPQTPVALTRQAYQHIIACARDARPHEACGVVRGRGGCGVAAIQGRNVADDPAQDYEIDVKTLLLKYEFERHGDALLGVYHSHPASEAYPSLMDAWSAYYPDLIYFICSLQDDSRPTLRAFSMGAHPLSLDEYTLSRAGRLADPRGQAPRMRSLRLQLRGLALDLREVRPLSQAFGAHLTAGDDVTALLTDITRQGAPFYLVCACPNDRIADVRIVTIRERLLQIL